MTLIQVLADQHSIHLACDFRLTNPLTGVVVQHDAHKLVRLNTPTMSAMVAVTGVAVLGNEPVGQWIARRVAGLTTHDEIVETLSQEGTAALSAVANLTLRRHTFVVAAVIGRRVSVCLISNFERVTGGRIARDAAAGPELNSTVIVPRSEVFLVTGAADAVPVQTRQDLKRLLRSRPVDERVQAALREANKEASQRWSTVSAGCVAASLHTDGRGSSRPFLTPEQSGNYVPPEITEQLRRIGHELRAAVGPDGTEQPIRVRGTAITRFGASLEYYRNELDRDPTRSFMWNNYGAHMSGLGRSSEAIEAYYNAIQLDATDATAHGNLAKQLWLSAGDMPAANHHYREAIRVSQPEVPSRLLCDYAMYLDYGLRDTEAAAVLYAGVVQKDGFAEAEAQLAFLLLRLGRHKGLAERLLTEAVETEPRNPGVLVPAGQVEWEFHGDVRAARNRFQDACTVAPRDLLALRWMADASLALGESATAAYYYRRAVRYGGADATLLGDYALCLLLERKPRASLRLLGRLRASEPDDTRIAFRTAAALVACHGNLDAACLLRDVLSTSLSKPIEVQGLGLLLVTGHAASHEVQRLERLLQEGQRGDGGLIRALVRDAPSAEREKGCALARRLEGTHTGEPNDEGRISAPRVPWRAPEDERRQRSAAAAGQVDLKGDDVRSGRDWTAFRAAIFPVTLREHGRSQTIGTAWHVGNGVLVTSTDVRKQAMDALADQPGSELGVFWLPVPGDVEPMRRPFDVEHNGWLAIQWVTDLDGGGATLFQVADPTLDGRSLLAALEMGFRPPDIGVATVTVGHPEPSAMPRADARLALAMPTMHAAVTEVVAQGGSPGMPYASFKTGPGNSEVMSGSPVFAASGTVVGVAVPAPQEGAEGRDGRSYAALLHPLLLMPVILSETEEVGVLDLVHEGCLRTDGSAAEAQVIELPDGLRNVRFPWTPSVPT